MRASPSSLCVNQARRERQSGGTVFVGDRFSRGSLMINVLIAHTIQRAPPDRGGVQHRSHLNLFYIYMLWQKSMRSEQ